MAYSVEYYQAIVQAYDNLMDHLNALCRHIYDELVDYPVWIMQDGKLVNDRDRVIYALKHFSPTPGLAPQETWACPGAVGCNNKTIELINAVNQAKDDLKAQAKAYHDAFKPNPTKPIREILSLNGYGYTKLKQVYRHIRYIDYHPDRIAWTKGKAYSHVVITPDQARKMLMEAGQGEHIDIQLAKLGMLEPHEKLVKRRAMKPYWVVNITQRDQDKTNHQKISTSLPLFYLHNHQDETPTVCLSDKSKDNRQARADKQIADESFLPSISVFRYKPL